MELSKCEIRRLERLEKQYPALIREWQLELNGGSFIHQQALTETRKAYWKCESCGHRFQQSLRSRVYQQTKCPACVKRQRSRRMRLAPFERSLGYLNPFLMKEWHADLNGDLNAFQLYPKTSTLIWWKCSNSTCHHVWQASAASRVGNRSGCPKCAKRRQSVAHWAPWLIREWNPVNNRGIELEVINRWSNQDGIWTCAYCHQLWEGGIQDYLKGRISCPHCDGVNQAMRAYQTYLIRTSLSKAVQYRRALSPRR